MAEVNLTQREMVGRVMVLGTSRALDVCRQRPVRHRFLHWLAGRVRTLQC